ncbi:DUF503 domain-containing protein [Halanaerobium hydrogeniformans]|uniref:YlxP-like protein n=1 Tax=Halanaerobium hydrogeniformans TaxID=656519 RepID=E4RN93_HALHG|nr:DUF503 domain-containing protein [Halanaerobium hydrogeniformans]ADQ14310.1 protein of unknown function DUF503 [Halanaerobium hydrogeniformans]
MIIASCKLKLYLPGLSSLKDKRHIIKSLLQKSKNKFNVAAAELESQDYLQTAVIGVVTVGNDYRYLQSIMDKYLDFIDTFHEFSVDDYEVNISR